MKKGKIKKIYEFIVRIFSSSSRFDVEKKNLKEIKEIHSLNRTKLMVFTLLGYAIVFSVLIIALQLFEVKQNVLLISSLTILFHFIMSLKIVGKKERGAKYFLERPLYNVGRGIHFVPWLVCTLDVKLRTYFEDELPANPEKIYRVERGEADFVPIEFLKQGYRPPLRITFSGLEKEEIEERKKFKDKGIDVDDPLEERITVEVPGIVIWRIVDLIIFSQTISSQEEAQRQMGDIYISMMMTWLSKITFKKFLAHKEDYDEELKKRLKSFTKNWGIEIITAKTKEYRGSRQLNILIQSIAEAKAKKRADTLGGRGLGDREKAILMGRTDGLLYMAKELNISPENALSMESARDIANKVNNLVLAGGKGGYTDLIGMVAAGTAALPPKDQKDVHKENIEGGEK